MNLCQQFCSISGVGKQQTDSAAVVFTFSDTVIQNKDKNLIKSTESSTITRSPLKQNVPKKSIQFQHRFKKVNIHIKPLFITEYPLIRAPSSLLRLNSSQL